MPYSSMNAKESKGLALIHFSYFPFVLTLLSNVIALLRTISNTIFLFRRKANKWIVITQAHSYNLRCISLYFKQIQVINWCVKLTKKREQFSPSANDVMHNLMPSPKFTITALTINLSKHNQKNTYRNIH